MARSSWKHGLVVVMLAGVLVAAAAAQVELEEDLYQPRPPCPPAQVEAIVREAVDREFRSNNQITAGLLRVFFHDCFSNGCDASILLDGEWDAVPNRGSVQPRVRQLVNEIRGRVDEKCGGQNSVSCADILALATRDSVAAARGPRVPIRLGRFDSKTPGSTGKLPGPGSSVPSMLSLFAEFDLRDPADLVALSGGHTVGKTKLCFAVRPGFTQSCRQNRNQQILDIITPDVFDNQYYVALTRGQGVFDSDQNLLNHPQTANLVRDFARDQNKFFTQWATSMTKLSQINWLTQQNGEIRRDCTKPNGGRINSIINDTIASF